MQEQATPTQWLMKKIDQINFNPYRFVFAYCAPLVTAYAVYTTLVNNLGLPEWVAFLSAAAFEFYGIKAAELPFAFYRWNRIRTKGPEKKNGTEGKTDEPAAPTLLAFVFALFYLVIAIVLGFVLKLLPPENSVLFYLISPFVVVGGFSTIELDRQHHVRLMVRQTKDDLKADAIQKKIDIRRQRESDNKELAQLRIKSEANATAIYNLTETNNESTALIKTTLAQLDNANEEINTLEERLRENDVLFDDRLRDNKAVVAELKLKIVDLETELENGGAQPVATVPAVTIPRQKTQARAQPTPQAIAGTGAGTGAGTSSATIDTAIDAIYSGATDEARLTIPQAVTKLRNLNPAVVESIPDVLNGATDTKQIATQLLAIDGDLSGADLALITRTSGSNGRKLKAQVVAQNKIGMGFTGNQ